MENQKTKDMAVKDVGSLDLSGSSRGQIKCTESKSQLI